MNRDITIWAPLLSISALSIAMYLAALFMSQKKGEKTKNRRKKPLPYLQLLLGLGLWCGALGLWMILAPSGVE